MYICTLERPLVKQKLNGKKIGQICTAMPPYPMRNIMAHARFTKSHISRVLKMNIHVWLFLIRKIRYVLMVC